MSLVPSATAFAVPEDENGVSTFELYAVRASLNTLDDETLSTWSALESSGPLVDWLATYDGLIWGHGVDHIVGQWVTPASDISDKDWCFFDRKNRDAPVEFPATSRLMGLVPTFVWHGWPRTSFKVYPPSDREEFVEVWTSLDLVRQFYLFSTNPDAAFEEFAVRGLRGETIVEDMVYQDGSTLQSRIFQQEGTQSTYTLSLVYKDGLTQGCPDSWRFIVKSPQVGRSRVTYARVRPLDESRAVPEEPADLLRVHEDVERIGTVGVVDRTGLGNWNHPLPVVEYVNPDMSTGLHLWLGESGGILTTNLITLAAVLGLFWAESRRYERRFK